MSQIEEEQSQAAHDPADLENLSPKEKAETEEILGELAKEGETKPKPGGEKEKGGEEIPPKIAATEELGEDGKPKPKVEPKTEPAQPPVRREASTVPAWKLKVAEDQKNRAEKAAADAKIEADKALANGGKPAEVVATEFETQLATIAEKSNIPVETLKELGKLFTPAPDPRIDVALQDVARRESEAAALLEVTAFNADFDKDILPLITEEYGDQSGKVPQATIDKIRADLAKIAYTPEYAKVPYNEIYLGRKDFRGVIPPAGAGGESSRPGAEGARVQVTAPEGALDWKKLESDPTFAFSDDELKGLSVEDMDKYFGILDKRK